MNKYAAAVAAILVGSAFSNQSLAEDYDYELGVSYGNGSNDIAAPLAVIGGSPFGSVITSTDSDAMDVAGTWYYSRLSDKDGPKSRAAFLNRASSVSLGYSYSDESSSVSSSGVPSPPFPPGLPPSLLPSGSTQSTTHQLDARLRHVWQSSGWYGLAGVSKLESDLDSVSSAGFSFSSEIGGSAYYAGLGKYVGEATALDFRVISSDLEGFDSTTYALSLNHVGSLGSQWQYAADLGFSMSDSVVHDRDGSYSVGLSLFPSSSLEFGFEAVHQEFEFISDRDSYEGFVSWFVRDHVELRAQYRDEDFDLGAIADTDGTHFGVGVNVRF